MLRICIYIVLLITFCTCKSSKTTADLLIATNLSDTPSDIDLVKEEVKKQLTTIPDSSLVKYYQHRDYKPIWIKDSLYKQGVQWIKDVKYHGLNPFMFNVHKLDSMANGIHIDSLKNYAAMAKLDLLLTETVRECGRNIHYGKLNPKDFHSGWNFQSSTELAPDSIWINSLQVHGIEYLNSFFEPQNTLYAKLRNELKRVYNKPELYQQKITDPGFKLQYGDSNKYVLPIKHKLLNIPADSAISMAFNRELRIAVVQFQKKHNLVPDGIVGSKTYHFLSWNKNSYIQALRINMERLKWLPDSSLEKGIVINIANQTLQYYRNNHLIFKSKVVVGKNKNETPVFSSQIDYLVFNPCWTVPKSIATTTILRGMQRDSTYLTRHHMFMCRDGKEILHDSIDINDYTSSNFPFQVFQRTAPNNALGQVKFMFDNRFSIYLHDTNQKSLFNKNYRTFSHGCVRVQNALDLADKIFTIDKQLKDKESYLAKGFPVKVYLHKQIPLSLVYITCHYDDTEKMIVYNKDVYLKDYKIVDQVIKNIY